MNLFKKLMKKLKFRSLDKLSEDCYPVKELTFYLSAYGGRYRTETSNGKIYKALNKVKEDLDIYDSIMIFGNPGSGKTELLKKIQESFVLATDKYSNFQTIFIDLDTYANSVDIYEEMSKKSKNPNKLTYQEELDYVINKLKEYDNSKTTANFYIFDDESEKEYHENEFLTIVVETREGIEKKTLTAKELYDFVYSNDGHSANIRLYEHDYRLHRKNLKKHERENVQKDILVLINGFHSFAYHSKYNFEIKEIIEFVDFLNENYPGKCKVIFTTDSDKAYNEEELKLKYDRKYETFYKSETKYRLKEEMNGFSKSKKSNDKTSMYFDYNLSNEDKILNLGKQIEEKFDSDVLTDENFKLNLYSNDAFLFYGRVAVGKSVLAQEIYKQLSKNDYFDAFMIDGRFYNYGGTKDSYHYHGNVAYTDSQYLTNQLLYLIEEREEDKDQFDHGDFVTYYDFYKFEERYQYNDILSVVVSENGKEDRIETMFAKNLYEKLENNENNVKYKLYNKYNYITDYYISYGDYVANKTILIVDEFDCLNEETKNKIKQLVENFDVKVIAFSFKEDTLDSEDISPQVYEIVDIKRNFSSCQYLNEDLIKDLINNDFHRLIIRRNRHMNFFDEHGVLFKKSN